MTTLGYSHEDARNVELGRVCASCGDDFVRGHDRPVVCEYCARQYAAAHEIPPHPVATHPLTTPELFKARARARRTTKESKGQ